MTMKRITLALAFVAIVPALAISTRAQSDGQACRAEARTVSGKDAVCTVCTRTVCDEATALRSPACHKETNTTCELSGSATTSSSRSAGPPMVASEDAGGGAAGGSQTAAKSKAAAAAAAQAKMAAAKMAGAKMAAAKQQQAAAARAAAMAEYMDEEGEGEMPMMRVMSRSKRGMARKMMEMMEEMED